MLTVISMSICINKMTIQIIYKQHPTGRFLFVLTNESTIRQDERFEEIQFNQRPFWYTICNVNIRYCTICSQNVFFSSVLLSLYLDFLYRFTKAIESNASTGKTYQDRDHLVSYRIESVQLEKKREYFPRY